MRFQLYVGVLIFFSATTLGFSSPVLGGGGGSSDTTKVLRSEEAPSEGVVIKRLNISPADINPNYGKVIRWDTNDIDMYHVDMAVFSDTLTYNFKNSAGEWAYAVPKVGRVTSGFGRRSLFGRKFHKGLDIDLETGDAVVAALGGKVRIAHYNRGYGNFVVISHQGGLETLYGHLSELHVTEGQEIEAGTQIGLGGSTGQSTGSHLHFEIRIFGEQVDPAWIIDTNTLLPLKETVKIDRSWFNHLLDMSEVPLHVVIDGETIDSICNMYEMDPATLLELNGFAPETTEIPLGTRLKLE